MDNKFCVLWSYGKR